MSRDDVIQVEGLVIEVLPNQLIRLELTNGHRLWARIPGRLRPWNLRFAPGDRARVEVSPFDLSKGCIVERLSEMNHESPRLS